LLAPGCDLDAADPTSGAADENYWQGTSEASAITAPRSRRSAHTSPTLTPQTAENDLTNADNGTLNIAQAFDNAGLTTIVAAGTAAEPASPATGQPPSRVNAVRRIDLHRLWHVLRWTNRVGGRGSARAPPGAGDDRDASGTSVTAVFANHRPGVAVQLRLLGYATHTRRLVILRSLVANGHSVTFTAGNAVEVEARYRDSYDSDRTGPWRTHRLPHSNAKQKATR